MTTYLVSQGYFDIFFPTDFDLLRDLYAATMGDGRTLAVSSHRDFVERWAELEHATLRDGTVPMLEMYTNAAFALSVGRAKDENAQ